MSKGIKILIAFLIPVIVLAGVSVGVIAGMLISDKDNRPTGAESETASEFAFVIEGEDTSETEGSFENILTPVPEDPEPERLAITDDDIETLIEFMRGTLGIIPFDCESTPYFNVINGFVFNFEGFPGYYNIIYGKPESFYTSSKADPLGRFGAYPEYYVCPEENVKWIIENVCNMEYDAAYKDDAFYTYNGKAYYAFSYAGDVAPEYELTRQERLSDGRYMLDFDEYYRGDISDFLSLVVDIRVTDGKRHMSFYVCERIGLPSAP